jgi:hypothetical protein
MKPLFISISGKKQTGKDQFATFLKERLQELEKHVTITHFADPLKEMCVTLFGLNPKLVYGSNADKETLTDLKWNGFPLRVRCKYSTETITKEILKDEWGSVVVTDDLLYVDEPNAVYTNPRSGPMTVREILQVMGTDIFRERVYQQIWAELPFKQEWTYSDGQPLDVIIISDCRFPNEVGETLKHDGLVIRVNRNTDNKDQHPSETALDNYDWKQSKHFIVDNNGTLEDLKRQAAVMASILRGDYL